MTPTHLKLKLESVQLIIRQLYEIEDSTESDTLIEVLEAYEYLILRSILQVESDVSDLLSLKKAIRAAGGLLVDLGQEQPEEMRGWFHGAEPLNRCFALANLLSRVILEITVVLIQFQEKYPALSPIFSEDTQRHAALIQDAEDAAGQQ